jgi:hypothetical protein
MANPSTLGQTANFTLSLRKLLIELSNWRTEQRTISAPAAVLL